jgi:putative tryptophan/tyrosine transport system substrate-binding protein
VDRRTFIVVGAAALAPLLAEAQQTGKMWRIGYLGDSSPSLESNLVEAFRRGLRERGYVEGRNIVIEYRWAEGTSDRFPLLVAELVRLKVDVIVTAGTTATLAAKRTTTTIPIVMAVTGDALGAGLVSSLARPGGNLTGMSTLLPELEGKRLELLKEVLPRLARVAVLTNPGNPFAAIDGKALRFAAEALRVKLQTIEIRVPEDFDRAFAAITNAHSDALTLIADRFLLAHRKRIVDFATRGHLAGIYPYSELVAEGGLMSYGPNYPTMFHHSAVYVDKILRGAKPGDLPVEQPTQFELVINLKTAKVLGLTIPPSLLLRADQIIE